MITGSDPTQIVTYLYLDGTANTILVSETITAEIKRGDVVVAAEVAVDLELAGSDLANGKIIAKWEAAVSTLWETGEATLWIKRDGQYWPNHELWIERGP